MNSTVGNYISSLKNGEFKERIVKNIIRDTPAPRTLPWQNPRSTFDEKTLTIESPNGTIHEKVYNKKGKLIRYEEFDKNRRLTDYYYLDKRVFEKENTKLNGKKSLVKILFDEDCELNCIELKNGINRVSVVKDGDHSLTPPKIKSRIELDEGGCFVYTMKKDLLDGWAEKLKK